MSKHTYTNEITFVATSGETGEPLQEIIFRQHYADKATQVAEQQELVMACFGAISQVSNSRADVEVPGLAEAKAKKNNGRR